MTKKKDKPPVEGTEEPGTAIAEETPQSSPAEDEAQAPAEAEPEAPAPAEAEVKAAAEAEASEAKRVRVICKGTLGSLMLTAGDETDKAEYVDLLKTRNGHLLVEAI